MKFDELMNDLTKAMLMKEIDRFSNACFRALGVKCTNRFKAEKGYYGFNKDVIREETKVTLQVVNSFIDSCSDVFDEDDIKVFKEAVKEQKKEVKKLLWDEIKEIESI